MIPDVDGWYVASVRVAGLVAMRLRGPPGVRGEGVEQRAICERRCSEPLRPARTRGDRTERGESDATEHLCPVVSLVQIEFAKLEK